MVRHSLLIVTVILIMATVANAQGLTRGQTPRSERWEFSVQTRYSLSEDYSGEGGSSLSVNEDLGWGFGFAYNLNQHFNLGLFFSWRSVPYEATAVDAENASETYRYGGEMDTSNLGLTGEYNILKGRFTPYVNGSVSWMHINSNILAGWAPGCWWDPWWGYVCGAVPLTYGDSTGAYSLGLGGRFELNEGLYLRAGYERGWVSSGSLDGSSMIRLDVGFMF